MVDEQTEAMVEKVARLLCGFWEGTPDEVFDGRPCWTRHTDEARAAIAAVIPPGFAVRRREPTPDMVAAAIDAVRRHPGVAIAFRDIYATMFDEPSASPDAAETGAPHAE